MAATRLRGRERETQQAVNKDDAYLYMLVISLVATIIGCVFLFLDWDSWQGKPSVPTIQPVVRGTDGNLPTSGVAPDKPN